MHPSSALAVVIVSWNVRDLLGPCLHFLFEDLDRSGLEAQVWVVDNGSTDGTPGMVAQTYPAVHLVVSHENLGFAGGNNLALRAILTPPSSTPNLQPPTSNFQPPTSKYIWLLNPDTAVQPGATAALMAALEANPRAGVAGAKLLYADGALQQSAFRFPGLIQQAFDLFYLPPRLYDSPLNGRYPRHLYEGASPFPVDHPLGAAMMVRAETIADVGLLDEGFWMYCEEIDWCWRMRKAGWRALCVPAAQVVHHAGRSTEQVRAAAFVALWRSRLRLYDRHYPSPKRHLAHRLVRLGMHWKIYQARMARRRGQINAAELAARLEPYQTILSL